METGRGRLSAWTSQSWLVSVGLFGLALILRLYCLDCQGLTYDEVASIEVAQRGLNAIFNERFGWMQLQAPLHYLLVWLTIQLVDPADTTVLVRLPSVIAGALTIPVVYALGREIFGKAQGLAAGLFMVLAAEHLNFSQNARPYAILVLLTMCSVYSLWLARDSGSPRWWTAFAVVTILAVLFSYNAVTIILPTLAPFIILIVWKIWRKREKQILIATAALFTVGVASLLMLVDLQQVPRVPPDLSRLFNGGIGAAIRAIAINPQLELTYYFASLSPIGGQLEQGIHVAFVAFAFLVAYLAFRQGVSGGREGAYLCLLFVFVPAALLAVLGTTNLVFQRYALFSMPFYFLLIANGAISLSLAALAVIKPPAQQRKLAALVVVLIILSPFLLSAYAYFRSHQDQSMTLAQPCDMRGASNFLAQEVRPEDTIVFAGLDDMVSNLYWRQSPPASVFNIVDPLLFQQPTGGSIFWLMSYEFGIPGQVLQDSRWSEIREFGCVTMLRENGPNTNALETVELFVAGIETELPETTATRQVANTLRGSIYQAQGKPEKAAQSYRDAGTFFPLAPEFLRTSRGYAAHNELDKAWRDAVAAKAMQPQKAEIHVWLAELLKERDFEVESRVARDIATELDQDK